MQDSSTSNWSKKRIIYVVLGALLVIIVASATAYILSQVSESSSDKTPTSEVPLSQKLTELYMNSDGAVQNASLNKAVVQKSAIDGYNNAYAKISGSGFDSSSVAYFYQTTDSSWHFFTVSKDKNKIACSEYNSDDLINAFIGFTCWDTANNISSFVEHPQTITNEADQGPGEIGG